MQKNALPNFCTPPDQSGAGVHTVSGQWRISITGLQKNNLYNFSVRQIIMVQIFYCLQQFILILPDMSDGNSVLEKNNRKER